MRGPIDYIIVGFEGNKFDGSIIKAIAGAVENGTIALVALAVVSKDDKGAATVVNITDIGDEYLVEFLKTNPVQDDLVSQEDIDEVGELLQPNTAAGLLVVEQLWAKPLKQALIDAKGVLIAEGRIHPDAAKEIDN